MERPLEAFNFQYIVQNGILDELARVFNNLSNSRILLAAAGFPDASMPAFDTALDFWSDVCRQIDTGVMENGFVPLLNAAAQRFPGNRVFRQHTQPVAPPALPVGQTQLPQPASSVNLVISGWEDPLVLLGEAHRQAQNQGRDPNSITLGFSNVEGVLLNLMGWTMDQAIVLQRALEATAAANDIEVDASVGTSEFRDYLLSRLFVEGPDQARYEINDVRASTPVGEIAKEVMNSFYDKDIFGKDKEGRGRQVVVDKQNEDGSTQRLDPNETLHDQEIQEGDTLSVAPEATAGAINPNEWKLHIVKAKNEILKYQKEHKGFKVSVNFANFPTEYLFKFATPSYGAPPPRKEDPVLVNNHEVFMIMPAGFPMTAPRAYWQTDIYHPNIHPKSGYVCMGDLADNWTPGVNFYVICQQLVDMAKFRNYSLFECFNEDALKWVKTPAGIIAIEKIGGHNLVNKIYRQLAKPRKLSIKKI